MSNKYGGRYSGMTKSQKKFAQKENAKLSKHEQKKINDSYRKSSGDKHSQVFRSGKDYDRNKSKSELKKLNDDLCDLEEEEEFFGF